MRKEIIGNATLYLWDEPAVDGPYATSEDLAKEFGATESEAKQFQIRLERLAGSVPTIVPELSCPHNPETCRRPTCDECVSKINE